ncbi:MAG: hypothetical protein JW834_02855 [Candidatus Diapherotrites archaeon]|nr:hypothetical protein [Candidatus Diapherotrites archaeon]
MADSLLSDWRVRILIIAVVFLGLGPLALKGLSYGMDFKGGSLIQLELEKPVDGPTMTTVTSILESRLNGFGLKDMSVKPWGDQYIIVEVSETDKDSVDIITETLSKQGRFSAVIEGEEVLRSEDLVQIITNPQEGYGYIASTGEWRVPFVLSAEGSKRFAENAEGKCRKVAGETVCERIYMFIDRPEDAVVLVPTAVYEAESVMNINPENPRSYSVNVSEFEMNSMTRIMPTDNVSDVLDEVLAAGYSEVIIPEDAGYDVSMLEQNNLSVALRPKTDFYWLWSAVNLKSILFLSPGVTTGEPVRDALITGHADNLQDAQRDLTQMVVVLRSGRLPVSVSIMSTMSVSPTLGKSFLGSVLWIGVLAILAVGLVVFLRYRNPKLTAAIIANDFMEVTIILGIASLINWQIDLAAVAGIIAVLGTSVDQLVVISDEAMQKREEELSLIARLKRAFSIIFVASATTAIAMFPLMTLGLGAMKGFAIVTIIGVVVGVGLVRPVFAKVIERIV